MTAKEDKKTPARVGRVLGLILAQRWGRPSLAGRLFPRRKAELCGSEDSGDGGHGHHKVCFYCRNFYCELPGVLFLLNTPSYTDSPWRFCSFS